MVRNMIKDMIIVLIILHPGCCSLGATTEKTVFTLYTTPASWNTAKNVCWRNRGRLASVNEPAVTSVLKAFGNKEWDRGPGSYWVGLFQQTGDATPNTWSGQCEAADNYKNWGVTAANPDDSGSCTSVNINTGLWSRKACDEKLNFVCESLEGVCYYQRKNGVFLDQQRVDKYQTITYVGDRQWYGCTSRCNEDVRSGQECWAAAYNTQSKICLLYHSDSQTAVADVNDERDYANTFLYRKVCFVGRVNVGALPDELTDDSRTIHRPCYQYEDPVQVPTSASPPAATRSETSSIGYTSTRPAEDATPVSSTTHQEKGPSTPTSNHTITTRSVVDATPVLPTTPEENGPSTSMSNHIITTRPVVDVTPVSSTTPEENRPSTPVPNPTITSLSHSARVTSDEWITLPTVTTVTPDSERQTVLATMPPDYDGNDNTLTLPHTADLSTCFCPCSTPSKLSQEESSVFMASVIQDMRINKTNTSTYRRKHISVVEDRPVTNAIGYLGTAIMALVFGGLVLLDLPVLYHQIKKLLNRLFGPSHK